MTEKEWRRQQAVKQRIQDYKDATDGDEDAVDRYFEHLHQQWREGRDRANQRRRERAAAEANHGVEAARR